MSVGPINRRRDVRRILPKLSLRIGSAEYHTRDWSLGGFALLEEGFTPLALEMEDEVSGVLAVEGRDGAYPFRAQFVRMDADGGVAGFRYIELDAQTFSVLERLLMRAEPPPEVVEELDEVPVPGSNWFTHMGSGGRR